MGSFISNGHDLRFQQKKIQKDENSFFFKIEIVLKPHFFLNGKEELFFHFFKSSRISEAVIKKEKTIKKLPGFNLRIPTLSYIVQLAQIKKINREQHCHRDQCFLTFFFCLQHTYKVSTEDICCLF